MARRLLLTAFALTNTLIKSEQHIRGRQLLGFDDPKTVETKEEEQTVQHQTVYYSRHRVDGAGSVIQDMLFAHAYVFSLNDNGKNAMFVYGGACSQRRMHKTEAALKGIGLLQELPVRLCKDESNIISPDVYRKDKLFHKPGWLKRIHSSIEQNIPVKLRSNASKHQHKTVVHIRRGDIGPCTNAGKTGYARYLPNSHYLEAISKYAPPQSHIQIISLKNPYENFTIFSEHLGPEGPVSDKNLSLEIDLDPTKTITQIWMEMMTADMLIISRSSYSYVPALLNINPNVQVIYTPFWHSKLPNWTKVDEEILEHTELESKRLKKIWCHQQ